MPGFVVGAPVHATNHPLLNSARFELNATMTIASAAAAELHGPVEGRGVDSPGWFALTAVWIAFFAVLLLAASRPNKGRWCIQQATAARWQWLLAILMILLALASMLTVRLGWMWVGRNQPTTLAVNVMMFWAIVPPLWFFTEHYCIDNDLIVYADAKAKAASLQSAKEYEGLASKIWAAVLAFLLFAMAGTQPG